MGRLIKYIFYLIVLGGIGLTGFTLFSDLPAPTTEVVIPVEPTDE